MIAPPLRTGRPRARRAASALAALLLAACTEGAPGASAGSGAGAAATASATPSATAAPPAASTTPALSGAASATPAPSAAPAALTPRNVVLLSIDSLRRDMPWDGYPRDIAPNLTRLAAESAVYTHAYSTSSYTAKSVGALLAGRYPSSLYRSGVFFTEYSEHNLFFPELLQERGIYTTALHSHLYFGRGKRLEQGFDTWELVPGIRFDSDTDRNVTSEKMTDGAIRQLRAAAASGRPFFAWFHYLDPHDEYVKHAGCPDFGRSNRDRYDSEVCHTDRHVGRLLDWMRAQPFWPQTVLFVTADHGEAFGEHGLYKHAFWLWEVVTRVPLLVHGPGIPPSRIDRNRGHIDLAPTILELLGVPDAPRGLVGRSLVPELTGREPPADRDPILLDLPADSHNPEVRAIVKGHEKLIVYGGGRAELYDLRRDPGELVDLARKEPERLARLRAAFDDAWKSVPIVTPYGGSKLRGGGTARGSPAPR